MGIEGYYEDYFDDREELRKLTNYDKIRNMTLDEMAEFLDTPDCYYCKVENCDDYDDCKEALIKWLQQESEE